MAIIIKKYIQFQGQGFFWQFWEGALDPSD